MWAKAGFLTPRFKISPSTIYSSQATHLEDNGLSSRPIEFITSPKRHWTMTSSYRIWICVVSDLRKMSANYSRPQTENILWIGDWELLEISNELDIYPFATASFCHKLHCLSKESWWISGYSGTLLREITSPLWMPILFMMLQGRKRSNTVLKARFKPMTSITTSAPLPSVTLLTLSCISAFFVWRFNSSAPSPLTSLSLLSMLSTARDGLVWNLLEQWKHVEHWSAPNYNHCRLTNLFSCEQLERVISPKMPVGKMSAIMTRVLSSMLVVPWRRYHHPAIREQVRLAEPERSLLSHHEE